VGFKRQAWLAAKGYPEWLYAAEDTLFNIRLRQLGFKFAFCREAIVRWRPRSTWRGLFRQHFNYARGNGRIGMGFVGYWVTFQYFALAAACLVAGIVWPIAALGAPLVLAQHARRNLWQQAARAARVTGRRKILWLSLGVMEVVRIAGLTGFIAGRLDRLRDRRMIGAQLAWMGADSVEDPPPLPAWSSAAMLVAIPVLVWLIIWRWRLDAVAPALAVTTLLALKSIKDFSRTGPQLKDEILHHYIWYSLLSFSRLSAWVFVLCLLMTGAGLVVLEGAATILNTTPGSTIRWLAGLAGIATVSGLQFCRHLLHIPGSIAASSNYRLSRLYPLWRSLTPRRLRFASGLIGLVFVGGALLAGLRAWSAGEAHSAALLGVCTGLYGLLLFSAIRYRDPRPRRRAAANGDRSPMNVLMIGADTLRADRLGIEGYSRPLTPTLDALARRGVYLSQCYIPCGRTAPSLVSLLTGVWPHTHGVRDNFGLSSEMSGQVPSLPDLLATAGYDTIAVSDWAGADLGKYPLGFARRAVPDDQWNIKYLLRQGPKDLRLFLSLFTHSRFGRRFLPELYYLAGVPMTTELGRTTREVISDCAARRRPFFLNAFFSSTHAPFASEHPYYTLFTDSKYAGPSKFVMGLMNDPVEIIKQQRHTVADFDLDQIRSLYDACARRFDDEVKRIIDHLEACGVLDRTLIVVYSDHGIEFFERDSWGQGNSVVVDGSSRIPLILLDPRAAEGRRIEEVTRSIDVAPTILELLGLPVPKTMEGLSLVQRIEGRVDRVERTAFEETGIWFTRIPGLPEGHLHYPDLPVLLETPDKTLGTLSVKPEYRELVIRARDRAIRTDRWKLVYLPMASGEPRLELFDLTVDRACEHDVLRQHPEVADALKRELFAWMRKSELHEALVMPVGAEAPPAGTAGAPLQPQPG
jgi:arylsulfatase A-like enzyme